MWKIMKSVVDVIKKEDTLRCPYREILGGRFIVPWLILALGVIVLYFVGENDEK